MKKIIFSIILSCAVITGKAQQTKRIAFTTSIGTAVAVSSPKSTPFTWQVSGHYRIGKRFAAGIGSGLSFYERALIPLFADVKFAIIKPRKFTPFLECAAGYSFAPGKNANGGAYVNPSVGVQYAIHGNKKLYIALGYELQEFERLKIQEQSLFTIEFAERLRHNSISVKAGFMF